MSSRSEPVGSLSIREQQVADLISSGLSNKAIAKQLALSEGTVKQHVHNILAKLRVRNRCELILLLMSFAGGVGMP
jgi:DNA-binding NarL/FixJ family response regulator